MLHKRIAKAVQEDGHLESHWQECPSHICWYPPAEMVSLEGELSAAELRAIADHMDKVNGEKK